MFRRTLAAVAGALLLAAAPAQAQLFDFEGADSPPGTSTPFSLTRGGLTATFTGSPNPFVITPSFFSTLTGNVLFDADGIQNTLEIGFSAPISSLSLLFALNDPTNTSMLTMNAFLAGAFVGSVSSNGAIPAGFGFPEGSLSIGSGPFDQVFLFSDFAPDFAIDDVRANAVGVVPEPATVALLATGLLAVGGVARRRARG